jgi:hypothetical protein
VLLIKCPDCQAKQNVTIEGNIEHLDRFFAPESFTAIDKMEQAYYYIEPPPVKKTGKLADLEEHYTQDTSVAPHFYDGQPLYSSAYPHPINNLAMWDKKLDECFERVSFNPTHLSRLREDQILNPMSETWQIDTISR